MKKKYFRITPLLSEETFIDHHIVSKNDPDRSWTATQIIGSQLGFRNFDNPIEQHEIDDNLIYSDPQLSGYQFYDEFDYIAGFEYRFNECFSEEEIESLIEAYEGATNHGIGAAWLETGDHEWELDGDEELYFECSVKIDLIDEDGEVIEENIQAIE
jgi:hypothetical protein